MGHARLTCALLLLTGALAAPAAAADLLSHRAVYHLSLAGSDQSLDLVEADGVLGIEWRADCDGWLSQQVLAFTAYTREGQELSYDVRFSSWESKDNDRLRFTVRRFDGRQLGEEFRGEAVLEETGGGVARFSEPEARTIELPAGTIFPTEHMRSVLASARAGERLVSHAVFDGTGPDALTQVTAAIGEPRGAAMADGGRRWPVSLAYYDLAAGNELPEFEATVLLDEGGVLRELVLDYGDFRLDATLENLEELPAPEC